MVLKEKIANVLNQDGEVVNIIVLDSSVDPSAFNAVWDDERNTEDASKIVRSERDKRLAEEIDLIVSNPLRYNALTEEEKTLLEEKRQALLDVPQQAGFPYDVVWP